MAEGIAAAIQSPIFLRAPNGADIWTIIELQGSIESKASNSLNGMQFAQLLWEPNCAAPFIIFGKQKAAGSWADLKKPLVVMAKVEGNPCQYQARGVVRRKLVFKARPKPITSSAVALALGKRVRLDGPEAPNGLGCLGGTTAPQALEVPVPVTGGAGAGGGGLLS
eukprot:CAMPEP_0119077184 /NCGR_PEP_ID=MMETSP1178-20130426/93166_1 /TAXON_ID=33656 /ORGANISM="unid sp, Strain CCMP2000" /LENGTH=165 /DNA_ID=CAMNT_0007059523 /DNA_START=34 /DNA_END=531 /DNA_ORIENTATION=-